MKYILAFLYSLAILSPPNGFKSQQTAYERVKKAYTEKETAVQKLFADQKLSLQSSEIFLRAFKEEKQLELWAKPKGKPTGWKLVKTYPVCSASGVAGPKRRQGDLQVPEGFYTINRWNPQSSFLLSLGLDYPNASDRVLSDRKQPGGDIFIHGNCVSIGCLAMTDPAIQEIYVAFVEAVNAGQTRVPVHIFPTRLRGATWERLQTNHRDDAVLAAFWQNLKTGHDWFEEKNALPRVSVDAKGGYVFR
ncbi:MAG: L,D-transpeptidase family protein [Cytophagales bacterium]|jgi:murein L,D-transpeptidase YafK|nr:L,D-transpeptidase family protein [Cytophagales bacterium]